MDFIQYEPARDTESIYDSDEDMEFQGTAFQYGEIKTLVDTNTIVDEQRNEMDDTIDELIIDIKAVTFNEGKRRNKKYGPDQIARFIRIMQEEGLSVPKASGVCGIPTNLITGL
ncbi:hypothetical protein BCR42DRAFT_399149 [Absidia repens]|uniref:Uncharacterized protein n=1 Tax=Absidia repens TaxID=90262 RepID=A0A1X2HFB9_9FUNG|nr:hypothetical protein BCR42DRAFT_399149 [Absidia repens]